MFSLPRVLVYLLPAVSLSVLLNIPRVLEWEVRQSWTPEGTNLSLYIPHEAPTELRQDQQYITYYLHATRHTQSWQ